MSIYLKRANELKKQGNRLKRQGMSEYAIKCVNEFDGSYKGAMVLAGQLKAIAQAAKCDCYWDEMVERGFYKAMQEIPNFRIKEQDNAN